MYFAILVSAMFALVSQHSRFFITFTASTLGGWLLVLHRGRALGGLGCCELFSVLFRFGNGDLNFFFGFFYDFLKFFFFSGLDEWVLVALRAEVIEAGVAVHFFTFGAELCFLVFYFLIVLSHLKLCESYK